MAEVHLTAKQAARVLKLSPFTVTRYCAQGAKGPFPRARLLYGSRKLGYRIPAGDLIAYAQKGGDDVVERMERALASHAAEDEEREAVEEAS